VLTSNTYIAIANLNCVSTEQVFNKSAADVCSAVILGILDYTLRPIILIKARASFLAA